MNRDVEAGTLVRKRGSLLEVKGGGEHKHHYRDKASGDKVVDWETE